MADTRTSPLLFLLVALLASGCGDSGSKESKAKPPAPVAKLPAPVFAKTVNLGAVSGKVTVELPGSSSFVPLSGARQFPVGTAVDAHAGVVGLTAASGTSDRPATGNFQAGVFEIRQDAAEPGITELRIRDDEATRAKCTPGSKGQFGRLLGDAKGRFRTRGRNSAATVRGTNWGVRDRCDGTLTIVREGEVVVTDLATNKEKVVHAGQTMLVKAP